jgi:hypothetical protein
MNWGKSIVLAFVLFALFIGSLVVVCLRQDIPLVSADYYQQELQFQTHIDQVKNTNRLTEKPSIQIVGKELEVKYSRLPKIADAELILFRPSDEHMDRTFKLNGTADVVQRFDVSTMAGGMYKARLRWTMDGKDYFLESVVYL